MIPLAVPNLSGNERNYLNQCIDTTFVSSVGEFVTRIEKMGADACGVKYGVATSAGTTGLHLALMGCGVERDDIVIIPTFTFIATANAVAHCGAVPWLMDIDSGTWTMDAGQLEKELSTKTEWRGDVLCHKRTGRRVAAIMPVYTLGNVADMERINEIAEKYRLPVIADAAAAIGATYHGKKIGKWAKLTVLSFNGNKTVTAGGGGMVLGDDEALLQKIRHTSTTARVTAEYDHDMVGYNYRMTNLQAAVGCAQMERLESFLERKRYIRAFYEKELADIPGSSFFPTPEGQESACWFSGIVLEDGGIETVRRICNALKEDGIEVRSFWKPVHLQKPYRESIRADSLEVAEGLWDRIVTLPCSTGITDGELERVVTVTKRCLTKEIG